MKQKMTSLSFDIDNPPPLTEAQREELERLKAMGDESIDFSDIPESDFSRGFRYQEWRLARRSQGLVVIEGDIRRWLESLGGDRHTQVNAILREAMTEQQARDSKAAA